LRRTFVVAAAQQLAGNVADAAFVSSGYSRTSSSKISGSACQRAVRISGTRRFVTNALINIVPRHPWFNPAIPVPYAGKVEAHVDFVSFCLRYR